MEKKIGTSLLSAKIIANCRVKQTVLNNQIILIKMVVSEAFGKEGKKKGTRILKIQPDF